MSQRLTRSSSRGAPAQPSECDVSIIVPTYKECANLRPLTERVFAALGRDANAELIIVDDNSRDGSAEAVADLQRTYPNVRIIVRTDERGLSSAVLRGFADANGRLLICMDADLQHPPESLPDMIGVLQNADFVIGTRYAGGTFQVGRRRDPSPPVLKRACTIRSTRTGRCTVRLCRPGRVCWPVRSAR